nr:RodZ domain-containing protein [Brevibacillus fulvus]
MQTAREEKGISLDDIQKITKIQRRYLEAIERGHFHLLPGHFYARAFIKSYAEAVGLDPNDVLSHFQSEIPAQPPQEQIERLRRRRVASASEKLQAGRWVTRSLLILFVLLIVGVIYMAAVNNNNLTAPPIAGNTDAQLPDVQNPTNNPAGATTPPAATQPAQPAQPMQPVEPSPIVETPVEQEKPTLLLESQKSSMYNYVLSAGDKLTIKLTAARGDCWLQVRDKARGKKYEEVTMRKGDEKTVELPVNTAYMVLGKPTSLDITINDVPLDASALKHFPSYVQIKVAETPQQTNTPQQP